MHVYVPERSLEGDRCARFGVDYFMGIPISPNYSSPAREDTLQNAKSALVSLVGIEGIWTVPATVVTLGARTGVTRMSRPMRNCVAISNNSGSFGNSKNRARTGGVPLIDEVANRVYCAREKEV